VIAFDPLPFPGGKGAGGNGQTEVVVSIKLGHKTSASLWRLLSFARVVLCRCLALGVCVDPRPRFAILGRCLVGMLSVLQKSRVRNIDVNALDALSCVL
jgi:hypothetical protein